MKHTYKTRASEHIRDAVDLLHFPKQQHLHNITCFNIVCKCGCSIECGIRMGEEVRYTKVSNSFASVGANETIRDPRLQIGANGNNMSEEEAHPRYLRLSSFRVYGISKRL